MTIARITTWADGQILTAAALNAEFDNLVVPINAQGAPTAPGASRVSGLTGSMISNIGSFAALGHTFQSTASQYSMTATSSYSINTQTVGPIINGRDQAAAFGSPAVHFYALTTGVGSTAAAGIASTRPPPLGPTMPSSYVGWAYLASAVYSTFSSGIVTASGGLVAGSNIYLRTPSGVLTDGAATVMTSVALDAGTQLIPSNAVESLLFTRKRGGRADATGALDVEASFYPTSSAVGGPNFTSVHVLGTVASSWELKGGSEAFRLPNIITTPPSIYYKLAINSGSSAVVSLNVMGYTVANGDV